MGASDTCLIIDSACDLPAGFIKQNNIAILPTSVRIGKQNFIDRRNEDDTLALYREGLNGHRFDCETTAFGVEQIRDAIVKRVATRYENALVLTISSSNSSLYENVRATLRDNQSHFREARRKSGRDEYFTIRVLDTETVFAGQAIIAHEAVRLTKNPGLPLNKLTARLEALCQQVYTYIIPSDIHPAFQKQLGQEPKFFGSFATRIADWFNVKPVIRMHCGESEITMKASGFDRALKLLFEHVMRQIKQGLEPKLVCISYAGDVRQIKNKSLYKQFVRFAEHYDVEVLVSVMSTTAAVNIGPGSFSLAFAAAQFK